MVIIEMKTVDHEMSYFSSQNVFCNPSFEMEPDGTEEVVWVAMSTEAVTEAARGGSSERGVPVLCARARWCGWPVVVASVAVVLFAGLGVTLVLVLINMNIDPTEGGVAPGPWTVDTVQALNTTPTILHTARGSARPQLGTSTYQGGASGHHLHHTCIALMIFTCSSLSPSSHCPPTECGGILTDSEGAISSPNHPGPYPPDSMCVWVIRVPPPSLVQLRVSSLAIEGPAPCLFDWLEVREVREQTTRVSRFCGSTAPPTVNTHSSTVWVSFHSDGNVEGGGFSAQYHAILPWQKSCSGEEFMCDGGRCLLPMSVCDDHPNCQDQSDEANCSHTHSECGGEMTGVSGFLTSPNHPKPYPHQQRCRWHISAGDGHAITLRFHNFSLEFQEACEFDYVEVRDGGRSGGGRVLGRWARPPCLSSGTPDHSIIFTCHKSHRFLRRERTITESGGVCGFILPDNISRLHFPDRRFCGSGLPPHLTSSGPMMTVVFVADEGVADSGFCASYQVITRSERGCGSGQFACPTGDCLPAERVCDGWDDCADGADEQSCSNSTFPPFKSSCERIQVEMCQGLSYNLTSFPNVWLSITDQSQAADMLGEYKALMELACFEPLRQLVCAMFLPQCSPWGGVLQPCRTVCSAARRRCGRALDLLGLSWPLGCHLLPDSQDPLACSLP
ncbi:membrane frizzled-related protein [Brachyhypopomus gauderio]|uniref:membrane frizzled-related protein n=1 Tax=Brachyhypopomus gauderio TaxID=698409 RepID=UPI004041370C